MSISELKKKPAGPWLKSAGKQLLTNGLAHQKYRVIRIDKPSAEEVGNNGSTAAPHLEALTK